MNKNIHSVIIAMLAIGLLITGAGVYLLSTQLADLKQTVSAPGKVSEESPNGKCVDSGGTYKNARCTCPKDFHLEDSYCVGADGSFGGVMGQEMRDDLEQEMRKNNCQDSGGTYQNRKCVCPAAYPTFEFETGQCVDEMGTPGGALGDQIRGNLELKLKESR